MFNVVLLEVTAPLPNVNLFGPSSTNMTSQSKAATPNQFKLPGKNDVTLLLLINKFLIKILLKQ